MAKQTKNVRGDYLPPDRYLTLEEVKSMRAFARNEGNRARKNSTIRGLTDELIVEILLLTGIRSEELCHITLRDLPTHHGKDVILIREKRKGQRPRAVVISHELIEKIEAYVKTARKGAKPGGPLFANEKGYRLLKTRVKRNGKWIIVKERTSRMSYPTLYRKIKRIARKAEVPNLRPHSLRHTFGSIFYAVDHDIAATAKMMGHKTVQTTQRYIGVFDDSLREQARKFGELLTDNG